MVTSETSGTVAFAFDGGLVLLDENRNRLFVYDGAAAEVWDAVAAGCSNAEIVSQIEQRNDAATSQAVTAMLEHWAASGLIQNVASMHQPTAENPTDLAISGGPRSRWSARLGPLLLDFETDIPEMERQLSTILGTTPRIGGACDAAFTIATLRSGEMLLSHDGAPILRTADDGLIRGMIYQTCLNIIHGFPEWLAQIHGAAVGYGDVALALPAPSGSGKTTLTAWLITRGFDYLADDLIAIRSDGYLAPWPMPISIKSGSLAALEAAYPGLAAIEAHKSRDRIVRPLAPPEDSWRHAPRRLSTIVFPRYDPSGPAASQRLRPLETLARLAGDRAWLGTRLTRERVAAFLAWLPTLPAYSISYPDLATAEHAIMTIVSRNVGAADAKRASAHG